MSTHVVEPGRLEPDRPAPERETPGRPEDAPEVLPPADQRGELTLHPRVVERIVQQSALVHSGCPDEPSVHVRDDSSDQLELEVSLVLVYPDEPLGPMMNRLRERVAADLERQTGRPVGRLDLRIERFVAAPRPGRRVE